MAKVTGIGGVFFRATDPKSLKSWYTEHLGVPKTPKGTMFSWFPLGEPETERMTVWSLFPRDTSYFGSSGQTFMINDIVDDIDGLIADLTAAGAEVDPKREDHPYGRFAWVTDPDGNRIELWEPPKATSVDGTSEVRIRDPKRADPLAIPPRSPWLFDIFRRYARGYVARHFHAVRLSKSGYVPSEETPGPVVVVLNHPSWWDPLVALRLSDLLGERTHYAPIDEAGLRKYPFLERLGFFGVEPNTSRGGLAFVRRGLALLAATDSVLWITAQGRFSDPRERPPRLKAGVSRLARRASRGCLLPLALEYPFWEERTPEALARFGTPIVFGDDQETIHWLTRIEAALVETQDALARDAMTRDPARFEVLLSGRVGVGLVYDGWRRFKAAMRGERFVASHGES